jgi:nicotinate-nucleotide adenylyltransferase
MSSTAQAKATELPIGILGGTFDPVHSAHLRLAEEALVRFGLERVLFVPTGRPWHRAAPIASADDRVAMVRLAIADKPAFAADDAEVRADAPGYTVDTLERLRGTHGRTRPLVLLLGADAFLGLPTWHHWQALFDLAHIAVATRPGHDLIPAAMPAQLAQEYRQRLASSQALADAPAGAIAPFILSAGQVSSTMIRTRLAAGEDIRDLLPDSVVDYIGRRHIYPN